MIFNNYVRFIQWHWGIWTHSTHVLYKYNKFSVKKSFQKVGGVVVIVGEGEVCKRVTLLYKWVKILTELWEVCVCARAWKKMKTIPPCFPNSPLLRDTRPALVFLSLSLSLTLLLPTGGAVDFHVLGLGWFLLGTSSTHCFLGRGGGLASSRSHFFWYPRSVN